MPVVFNGSWSAWWHQTAQADQTAQAERPLCLTNGAPPEPETLQKLSFATLGLLNANGNVAAASKRVTQLWQHVTQLAGIGLV
jgi:hypothetical protein